MADISTWSSSAASNNQTPPDGFPEGQAPSTVNNAARETMAAMRRWYEDAQWADLGHVPTFVSASSFSIPTDLTATYEVGRRIRIADSSTLYGRITASVFSSVTTVTVALDSGSITVSISAVAPSIATRSNAAFFPGIDDQAAATRVTLLNAAVGFGDPDAAQSFTIGNARDDAITYFAGGDNASDGANWEMRGSAQAQPAQALLRQGTTNRFLVDDTTAGGDIVFFANDGSTAGLRVDGATGAVTAGGGTNATYDFNIHTLSGDADLRILAGENLSSADTFLRLQVTNSDASNYIYFGDSDVDVGSFRYNHNTDTLALTVGTSLIGTLSSSSWDFESNPLIGVTDITGEGVEFTLSNAGDDARTAILGASSKANGGYGTFYGNSDASFPGDIIFGSGSSAKMQWDDSASIWTTNGNTFRTDGGNIRTVASGTPSTSVHGLYVNHDTTMYWSGNRTASQTSFNVFGTAGECRIKGDGDLENTNNAYGALSDLKLKENVSPAKSQWADIKALKLVNYSLIADQRDSANMLGVIAQDLEAAGMGSLVSTSETDVLDKDGNPTGKVDTTKGVKYSVLYLKALGAMQEMMARIETLEQKVA